MDKYYFKSKVVENAILEKVFKTNIDELTEEDIASINNLVIENEKKSVKIDLLDLEKLPNLKSLILINFKINNYETNILNRCKNLEKVEFVRCKIVSKSRLLNENIKNVYIDNCSKVRSNYINKVMNVETLFINNIRKFDAQNIIRLAKLQNLTINNVRIKASKYLLKIVKLNYLNLIDSKYDKSIEKRLSNNVVFEK